MKTTGEKGHVRGPQGIENLHVLDLENRDMPCPTKEQEFLAYEIYALSN